ncbi:MAG TPA: Hsp20/alpha crystallin family protein [Tenuifilaceae bacterium]|nr:Hsp20/alpha crystallin family protein [Tenuifilaceae bacterium]HOZ15700.1 Hsp20/alpha crystallin family protein [Tenuifilaceae bacterium]HPI44941.1 Hsp20/alpha crystallin family protein [Tenuifilaceae bacterium]HPN21620.1 Hsp20/alpha crystallin family protein [Tenuifilaceae bacterium]HPV56725.1 Hsp20/alpha crystallin family protein [Tenuifilaceae bacterium]
MTLVSFYNPEMLTSRRFNGFDLNNFFRTANGFNEAGRNYPAVNIVEEAERYRIEVAAPGYSKDDFKVKVENDLLNISVEKEQNKVEGESLNRCEFYNGSFERSFVVGKTIDINKIDARYENGILTITLSKKEEAKPQQPRSISIS